MIIIIITLHGSSSCGTCVQLSQCHTVWSHCHHHHPLLVHCAFSVMFRWVYACMWALDGRWDLTALACS
jgi:hypothetical protein